MGNNKNNVIHILYKAIKCYAKFSGKINSLSM